VFFLFDLLHLDGEAIHELPLRDRKERLRDLLSGAGSPLHFSDHQIGRGQAFYDRACALKVEGIVSKRVDAPYAPGNRGLWVKTKCLNRDQRQATHTHFRGSEFGATDEFSLPAYFRTQPLSPAAGHL
jgi:bifunctional non-homologous end joining protein LigD